MWVLPSARPQRPAEAARGDQHHADRRPGARCWLPASYTGNPLAWTPPGLLPPGWEQLAVPAIPGPVKGPPGALPSATLDLGPQLTPPIFGVKSIFLEPGDPILDVHLGRARNGTQRPRRRVRDRARNLFQVRPCSRRSRRSVTATSRTSPSDTRDWRYYFQVLGPAGVQHKYLLNRGQPNGAGQLGQITWQDLYADDLAAPAREEAPSGSTTTSSSST